MPSEPSTRRWLTAAAAAEVLGITASSVRRRDLPRRNSTTARCFEYGIDVEAAAVPPEPQRLEVHHDTDAGHGSAYVFDESRDRYIFSLRSKAYAGRPFVLTGETVRSMILAYSRDGETASINAIARTFGLHRTSVREVLRALGKTHDSAPFSDEDIARRTDEDLGEDLVRLREERVLRSVERAQWAETKKLAEQARHFERFVASRLDALVRACPPIPAPPAVRGALGEAEGFAVVYGLTDAHFGAAGWADEVGQEISRAIVRERALATTQRLITRVLRYGRPAKWIVPAGSDNFHADTDLGTTTKGTPLDTDGSFARMFIEGCALYEEIVLMLAAVAPVEVIAMPGNHDRLASMMLAHWLAARFRESSQVHVGSAVAHRTYILHGRSLIGLTHGDGIKDDKLPLIMASEAAEAWGASAHRIILTGHLHTDRANEFAGVRVIHMPCLATADRWHYRNAYVGNTKAIAAYLIDEHEGLVAAFPIQPPPKETA